MMHMSDAEAPHARSTDARPVHEARISAQISPPTRRMQPEGASGSKGGPNDGPESARAGTARHAHVSAPSRNAPLALCGATGSSWPAWKSQITWTDRPAHGTV